MKSRILLPHTITLSTLAALKLAVLALFSTLMSRQACPSWFLGLLLSVNILQCMGLVALKLPTHGHRTPFAPLRIGHANSVLQFFWAAALFFLPTMPAVIYGAAYSALGSLQLVVFFKYLFRFRLLLGRILHPRMAPLPPLHETAT